MDIEQFFSGQLSSPSVAFTSSPNHRPTTLPSEVRQSADLGWKIFPVSPLAKLMGNSDLLISEATSDISVLEELAAEYPSSEWRVVTGPSSLCVLQLDGPEGRNSFAVLSQDHGDCLTLQAHRGDVAWAFFRRPAGSALRALAKKLAPGVRILGDGDSCPVPPSYGYAFVNPWADVETMPYWLQELAFETPDMPPGKAAPVPASSLRPARCRSRAQFSTPPREARKGYPVGGCSGGYRICRRR